MIEKALTGEALSLDILAERVMSFVRKYDPFDSPPAQKPFVPPVHMPHRHEVIDMPDDERRLIDDSHKFSLAQMNPSTYKSYIYGLPEDFTVIDIGSGVGKDIALPLAEKRHDINILMVDDFHPAIIEQVLEMMPEYRAFFSPGDLESTYNAFLQHKGYRNVRFFNQHLTLDDYSLSFDVAGIDPQKIAVLGIKNPAGLGNITCRIAAELGAKKVFLSNSVIYKLPLDSEHLSHLEMYLSLHHFKKEEIEKLKSNFQLIGERVAYSKDPHIIDCRYALALELLFVLPQADLLHREGYDISIYENHQIDYKIGKSGFLMLAEKK